jgi:hypothetical protein
MRLKYPHARDHGRTRRALQGGPAGCNWQARTEMHGAPAGAVQLHRALRRGPERRRPSAKAVLDRGHNWAAYSKYLLGWAKINWAHLGCIFFLRLLSHDRLLTRNNLTLGKEDRLIDLFLGGKLAEYESAMAKGGADEGDGGLRKCVFISGEASGTTWNAPGPRGGGA